MTKSKTKKRMAPTNGPFALFAWDPLSPLELGNLLAWEGAYRRLGQRPNYPGAENYLWLLHRYDLNIWWLYNFDIDAWEIQP